MLSSRYSLRCMVHILINSLICLCTEDQPSIQWTSSNQNPYNSPNEAIPAIPIKRCISNTDNPHFPCSINDIIYNCASAKACGQGSYGTIFVVQRILYDNTRTPFIYAMKFSRGLNAFEDPNLIDEYYASRIIMNQVAMKLNKTEQHTLPTIRVWNGESQLIRNRLRSVIVMDYLPWGDLELFRLEKLSLQHHKKMLLNRDMYVWKLLKDISLVLETMHENQWIDREVSMRNILITGDLSDAQTTAFVKTDYGKVISYNAAKTELVDPMDRFLFCHHGTNVKCKFQLLSILMTINFC